MTASILAAAIAFAKPVVPGDYSGAWEVSVVTDGEVESRVLDREGNLVAGPFAAKRFNVFSPKPWTGETPEWYRLSVTRIAGGEESVFGFAEMTIDGGRLFVNGRPVRVKLGPRELGGNAAVASDSFSDADAWTNGIYRLAQDRLSILEVERERTCPEATRYAFRDWTVKGTNYNQRFVVANRNAFTDASDVTCRWHLLLDGEEDDSGVLDLYALAPGREATFDMIPEAVAALHGESSVSVRFTFKKDGEIVATDQIDLVATREPDSLSEKNGWLPEWLSLGLFKPAVTVSSGEVEPFGVVRAFETGRCRFLFDEKLPVCGAFMRKGILSDAVLVRSAMPCREIPADGDPLLDGMTLSGVSNSGGALSFSAEGEDSGVSYRTEWTIHPTGVVSVKARLKATAEPALTRLGFVFGCPDPVTGTWDGETMEWFGPGPRATAPGDDEGAFLGRWERTVGAEPFTAEAVRGVKVGDFAVRTIGAPFAVKADAKSLAVFAPTGADGVAEISFTMSAGDKSLAARTP